VSFRLAVLSSVVACTAVLAAQAPAPAPVPNDLDAFMAKVLEKRNENWRTLHDYILSERETFQLLGPGGLPLHGLRRDFHWFIRDGYLIRSPVKANGVEIAEPERKKYEDRWLADEKEREKHAADKDEKRKVELSMSVTGDVQFSGFAGSGVEPRFISEAYFMKFKFEPGNYYFAGREHLDGREVLKIEYLPSKMFNDEPSKSSKGDTKPAASETKAEPKPASGKPAPPRKKGNETASPDEDEKIERAMNKTSAVTMWIDPQEYQIVRFRFDNVDWGFLPGRQLARVDEARASMTMGRVFDGIWLPKDVTFTGTVTFAPGTLRFTYSRDFFDYRRGEVSARIRGYIPREPQS
jgi:hypothetical protein